MTDLPGRPRSLASDSLPIPVEGPLSVRDVFRWILKERIRCLWTEHGSLTGILCLALILILALAGIGTSIMVLDLGQAVLSPRGLAVLTLGLVLGMDLYFLGIRTMSLRRAPVPFALTSYEVWARLPVPSSWVFRAAALASLLSFLPLRLVSLGIMIAGLGPGNLADPVYLCLVLLVLILAWWAQEMVAGVLYMELRSRWLSMLERLQASVGLLLILFLIGFHLSHQWDSSESLLYGLSQSLERGWVLLLTHPLGWALASGVVRSAQPALGTLAMLASGVTCVLILITCSNRMARLAGEQPWFVSPTIRRSLDRRWGEGFQRIWPWSPRDGSDWSLVVFLFLLASGTPFLLREHHDVRVVCAAIASIGLVILGPGEWLKIGPAHARLCVLPIRGESIMAHVATGASIWLTLFGLVHQGVHFSVNGVPPPSILLGETALVVGSAVLTAWWGVAVMAAQVSFHQHLAAIDTLSTIFMTCTAIIGALSIAFFLCVGSLHPTLATGWFLLLSGCLFWDHGRYRLTYLPDPGGPPPPSARGIEALGFLVLALLGSAVYSNLTLSGPTQGGESGWMILIVAALPCFLTLSWFPWERTVRVRKRPQVLSRKLALGFILPFVTLGLTLLYMELLEVLGVGVRAEDSPLSWLMPPPDSTFGVRVLFILTVSVLVPSGEEIFFRGYLLDSLRTSWRSRSLAVLASSVTFALLHPLVAFPVIMALGLIYSLCYLRTGSLLPGIIGHGIHNAILIGFAMVQAAVPPGEMARSRGPGMSLERWTMTIPPVEVPSTIPMLDGGDPVSTPRETSESCPPGPDRETWLAWGRAFAGRVACDTALICYRHAARTPRSTQEVRGEIALVLYRSGRHEELREQLEDPALEGSSGPLRQLLDLAWRESRRADHEKSPRYWTDFRKQRPPRPATEKGMIHELRRIVEKESPGSGRDRPETVALAMEVADRLQAHDALPLIARWYGPGFFQTGRLPWGRWVRVFALCPDFPRLRHKIRSWIHHHDSWPTPLTWFANPLREALLDRDRERMRDVMDHLLAGSPEAPAGEIPAPEDLTEGELQYLVAGSFIHGPFMVEGLSALEASASLGEPAAVRALERARRYRDWTFTIRRLLDDLKTRLRLRLARGALAAGDPEKAVHFLGISGSDRMSFPPGLWRWETVHYWRVAVQAWCRMRGTSAGSPEYPLPDLDGPYLASDIVPTWSDGLGPFLLAHALREDLSTGERDRITDHELPLVRRALALVAGERYQEARRLLGMAGLYVERIGALEALLEIERNGFQEALDICKVAASKLRHPWAARALRIVLINHGIPVPTSLEARAEEEDPELLLPPAFLQALKERESPEDCSVPELMKRRLYGRAIRLLSDVAVPGRKEERTRVEDPPSPGSTALPPVVRAWKHLIDCRLARDKQQPLPEEIASAMNDVLEAGEIELAGMMGRLIEPRALDTEITHSLVLLAHRVGSRSLAGDLLSPEWTRMESGFVNELEQVVAGWGEVPPSSPATPASPPRTGSPAWILVALVFGGFLSFLLTWRLRCLTDPLRPGGE